MAPSTPAESQVTGPLVGTKLRAPASASGYRERPRITALLDPTLTDTTRLTLLSAPPGYGKTIAVAGWLAARGVPLAWLSLDPADNDLARFVRYLAAALRSVRPDAGAAMARLSGPGTNPTPDLVGAITVDAMAASDEPFVLVLDDYHVVTAEPIERLVRFLIEHGLPFDCRALRRRAVPGAHRSRGLRDGDRLTGEIKRWRIQPPLRQSGAAW